MPKTALTFIVGGLALAGIIPFNGFFSMNFDLFFTVFLAVILVTALVEFRFWCKYFCPAGGFMKILALKAPFFRMKPCAECNACRRCLKSCDLISLGENGLEVDRSECTFDGFCKVRRNPLKEERNK